VNILSIEAVDYPAAELPTAAQRGNYSKYVKFQCWINDTSTTKPSPMNDLNIPKYCPANGACE
jgi:hypothetical protein